MTSSRPHPRLALIAAMATNRVIGRDGDMPWKIPADLAYFRKLTQGHPIIMGRRTWESLGRPLPNRRNIVVTSRPASDFVGAEVAASFEAALALCSGSELVFCIGGGQLYRAALAQADSLYLTEIHQAIDGDTVFPEFDPAAWREAYRYPQTQADAPQRFDFVRYDRR